MKAAANGGAVELSLWYKALAEATPLWTRQQAVYEQLWGRQTTELQAISPWRVMSHGLESDAPASTALGAQRLFLEFIAQIDETKRLELAALSQAANAQLEKNLVALRPAATIIQTFVASNLPSRELRPLRRALGMFNTPGPRGVLTRDQIRALVCGAKAWLLATQKGLKNGVAITRTLLPFLDAAEFEYVSSSCEEGGWRTAATFLVQRRLAAFPGGAISPATVYEYSFGRSEAAKFRLVARSEANPIAPPVVSYQG